MSKAAAEPIPSPATVEKGQSVVTWGQSNASYIVAFARQDWERGLDELMPPPRTRLVQGATAGTFLRRSSAGAGEGYWVDDTSEAMNWGPAGRVFVEALEAEIAAGHSVAALIGAGHEGDAGKLRTPAQAEHYREVQKWVFDEARALLADAGQAPAPVFIVPIGRRGEADYRFQEGVQAIKRIQRSLAEDHDWIYLLPENHDIETDGGAHLRTEGHPNGYQQAVARQTRKVARVLGAPVPGGVDGPQIVGAERTGRRVLVTLRHDGGTDLVPREGIEGFRYTVDDDPIAIRQATRQGARTIVLDLAALPGAGRETLFYGYGTLAGTDPARILRDNQKVALPVRFFEGSPVVRPIRD